MNSNTTECAFRVKEGVQQTVDVALTASVAQQPQSAYVVWPGNVVPTYIFPPHANPMPGTFFFRLSGRDDQEVDLEPFWTAVIPFMPPTIELAVDEGEGFRPFEQYQSQFTAPQIHARSPWLLKRRVLRFRIMPGAANEATLKMTIDKVPNVSTY
jgi:hypothetical protein